MQRKDFDSMAAYQELAWRWAKVIEAKGSTDVAASDAPSTAPIDDAAPEVLPALPDFMSSLKQKLGAGSTRPHPGASQGQAHGAQGQA
mmetsp:Transcript_19295/g.57286  ORF Transcript_19295/g.57286 Transcript_19295/m.57286 type:complete len:88 (+) Transcript_19295:126-389(+)